MKNVKIAIGLIIFAVILGFAYQSHKEGSEQMHKAVAEGKL